MTFNDHLLFQMLELELGETISLTDKMFLASTQERYNIVFSVTSKNFVKPMEFFKRNPFDFYFIQDDEILVFDHIDFSRPFYAYYKSAFSSNKLSGKKLHEFFVYRATNL